MSDQPGDVEPDFDFSAIEDTDNTAKPEDGDQDGLDQSRGSAYDDVGDPADALLPLPGSEP